MLNGWRCAESVEGEGRDGSRPVAVTLNIMMGLEEEEEDAVRPKKEVREEEEEGLAAFCGEVMDLL